MPLVILGYHDVVHVNQNKQSQILVGVYVWVGSGGTEIGALKYIVQSRSATIFSTVSAYK